MDNGDPFRTGWSGPVSRLLMNQTFSSQRCHYAPCCPSDPNMMVLGAAVSTPRFGFICCFNSGCTPRAKDRLTRLNVFLFGYNIHFSRIFFVQKKKEWTKKSYIDIENFPRILFGVERGMSCPFKMVADDKIWLC